MRRDDDAIVMALASRNGHRDHLGRASDMRYRRVELEPEAAASHEPRDQRVDVTPAAADDRAPRQRTYRRQHAVLIEKREVGDRGKRAAVVRRERPQRSGEW